MKFHLSLSELFGSKVKLTIIKFLLNHKASMSEREIASILGVSHMSVNRTMRELAELNFVKYLVIGKAHLWQVNHKSFSCTMLEKAIKNIEIWSSPLTELSQAIVRRFPLKLIKRLVLFGSISTNTEKPDSDIDLFILVKDESLKAKIEEPINQLSTECLDLFGNRLSPYILTEREYQQNQSLKLIEQINKGIQLYPSGKISR